MLYSQICNNHHRGKSDICISEMGHPRVLRQTLHIIVIKESPVGNCCKEPLSLGLLKLAYVKSNHHRQTTISNHYMDILHHHGD
jgi:hypothetical protein